MIHILISWVQDHKGFVLLMKLECSSGNVRVVVDLFYFRWSSDAKEPDELMKGVEMRAPK